MGRRAKLAVLRFPHAPRSESHGRRGPVVASRGDRCRAGTLATVVALPPAFTRQLVIDRYIVDLACRAAKLAIEFDGGQHHEQTAYDAERTAVLEGLGWKVIRLWNSDVMANPEGAAEYILSEAAECLGGTHPQPLPSREGRARCPRFV